MNKTRFFAAALAALFLGAQAAWCAEAIDDREYKFMQGVINARGPGVVILNETVKVKLTRDTKFFDSAARKSDLRSMGRYKWLYVEGVKEPDGSITAEEVYYLPGYVSRKEMKKYGFMQLP
jgi:hypothetical protein